MHHHDRRRNGARRQIVRDAMRRARCKLRTSGWLWCGVRPRGCSRARTVGVACVRPGLWRVCRQHWRWLLQVLLGGRAVVVACACGPGALSPCFNVCGSCKSGTRTPASP